MGVRKRMGTSSRGVLGLGEVIGRIGRGMPVPTFMAKGNIGLKDIVLK